MASLPALPIVTRTATLELLAPEVHLMRYRPGITVDAASIQENTRASSAFPPARATIVVIPEGASFSMDMLESDHSLGYNGTDGLLAMVVEDPVFVHASGLYFAYHPPPYRFRIFTALASAKAWVKDELAAS